MGSIPSLIHTDGTIQILNQKEPEGRYCHRLCTTIVLCENCHTVLSVFLGPIWVRGFRDIHVWQPITRIHSSKPQEVKSTGPLTPHYTKFTIAQSRKDIRSPVCFISLILGNSRLPTKSLDYEWENVFGFYKSDHTSAREVFLLQLSDLSKCDFSG